MYSEQNQDNEQKEILLLFVDEGLEMLDEVEPLLIEIEQEAEEDGEPDPESINTVFRFFHSLKGGAGFLDLNTVNRVTHEVETLLDMFRKGKAKLTSEHIDLINRSCDFIRQLLNVISEQLSDKGFEEEAEDLKAELKRTIVSLESGESKEIKKEADKTIEAGPVAEISEDTGDEEDLDLDELMRLAKAEEEEENAEVDEFILPISQEMVDSFLAEGEELLNTGEEALLGLEQEPENNEYLDNAFRAFHSFKGNAGLLGYGDLQSLGHEAETVLEGLRSKTIKSNSKILTLLLEIIDFLRGGLNQLSDGNDPTIMATQGLIHLLQDMAPAPSSDEVKETKPEALTNDEILEATSKSETKKAEEPKISEEPAKKDSKKEIEQPKIAKPDVATLKAKSRLQGSEETGKVKKERRQRQSIRVDVEKLDILLDLVGELVITEAMVTQNPDLQGLEISLDRFEESTMQLNKLTRELQDISTSMRMIQLSATFRRMVRLVRDLGQKAGKKVNLRIVGENTEVDKTVIEQINDPLVHIIRNSIDHGLETPDDREKVGKSPEGDLLLEAKYVGNEVWIQISDDGRGLNRDKILKRVRERDLFDGDADELKDEEVWQFIFQPGFSTAEKITDVSGRGVGMDVVRRNIEGIRGRVDVRSTENVGTTVVLRIPLTLAIIDGMLIRVGTSKYAIPLTVIKESLQIDPKLIVSPMEGEEIVKIREDLLPVVRLGDFFEADSDSHKLEEGILMVVEDQGNTLCLFVDEIIGQQQIVIKGLSEYIGHKKGVSGCTILGDGSISLILDVAEIAEANKIDSESFVE